MIDRQLLLELLEAEYEDDAIALLSKRGYPRKPSQGAGSPWAICLTTNPSFTRNSLRRQRLWWRSLRTVLTASRFAVARPKLSILAALPLLII